MKPDMDTSFCFDRTISLPRILFLRISENKTHYYIKNLLIFCFTRNL